MGYRDILSLVSICGSWTRKARELGVLERQGVHELFRAAQRAAKAAAYATVSSLIRCSIEV